MVSLRDILLDEQGRLRNAPAIANPPRPPADVPPLGRYLVSGKATQHVTGLSDPMQQRLLSFFNSMPPEIQAGTQILSGYRTPQQQQILWDRALQKYGSPAAARKWVAPPGSSQHNHRNAVDLHYTTPEAKRWAHENAQKHGLKFPLKNEAWHIEVSETRGGPKFAGQLNTNVQQTASAAPVSTPATRTAMPPPSGSVQRGGRGGAISPDMAMSKLQSLGFNEAQSKAIVGNMVAESALRPNTVNGKEGSYGLMQWRGDRFTALNEFAASKGTTWRDPNTQMEFIAHEMRNNPYEAKQSAAFRNATTVEDANRGMKSYLRYGTNTEGKRLQYANAVQTPAGNIAASSVTQQPAVQAINTAAPPAAAPTAPAYAPTQQPVEAPATQPAVSPAAPVPGALEVPMPPERPAGLAQASPFDEAGFSQTTVPAVPSVQQRIDDYVTSKYGPDLPPATASAFDEAGFIDAIAPPGAQAQAQARPPVSRPRPAAPAPARITVNAPPRAAESPLGRSRLAQDIIAGYGPAGRDLTTFRDPVTGHEHITGSMGGETMSRNLGRTSPMDAVRQAVGAVPLPKPRPAMPSTEPLPGMAPDTWPPKTTIDPLREAGTRELGGRGLLQPFQAPTHDFSTMGGVHRGAGGFNTLGEWPAPAGQNRLSLSPFQPRPNSPTWPAPAAPTPAPAPAQTASMTPLQWWQLDPSLFGGAYGMGATPGGYFGGGGDGISAFSGIGFGGTGGW